MLSWNILDSTCMVAQPFLFLMESCIRDVLVVLLMIVNRYIEAKANTSRFHFFRSFFFTKLSQSERNQGNDVKRWTKVSVHQCDLTRTATWAGRDNRHQVYFNPHPQLPPIVMVSMRIFLSSADVSFALHWWDSHYKYGSLVENIWRIFASFHMACSFVIMPSLQWLVVSF